MANALLLNALQHALSDFVVGLSPEWLKVGVGSGKIVLDGLQVNSSVKAPAALDDAHVQNVQYCAGLEFSSSAFGSDEHRDGKF